MAAHTTRRLSVFIFNPLRNSVTNIPYTFLTQARLVSRLRLLVNLVLLLNTTALTKSNTKLYVTQRLTTANYRFGINLAILSLSKTKLLFLMDARLPVVLKKQLSIRLYSRPLKQLLAQLDLKFFLKLKALWI